MPVEICLPVSKELAGGTVIRIDQYSATCFRTDVDVFRHVYRVPCAVSCTASYALRITYCVSRTASHVLHLMYCISCTACHVLRVMYCVSCTASHVLRVMYFVLVCSILCNALYALRP